MDLTKFKVGIGTPAFGGQVYSKYMLSLIGALMDLQKHGIGSQIMPMPADSLVQRGRNTICHYFMNDSDCTHLMFIDADIGFAPDAVRKLLEADVDVIGAGYPIKAYEPKRIVEAVKKGARLEDSLYYGTRNVVQLKNKSKFTVEVGKPIELDAEENVFYLGTGFMLIKREVFEKFQQQYPEQRHKSTELKSDNVYAYFDCMISDNGYYLSEDYYFCEKLREMKVPVHVDPLLQLSHTGTHTFEGDFLSASGYIYEQHKETKD